MILQKLRLFSSIFEDSDGFIVGLIGLA